MTAREAERMVKEVHEVLRGRTDLRDSVDQIAHQVSKLAEEDATEEQIKDYLLACGLNEEEAWCIYSRYPSDELPPLGDNEAF